MAETIQIALLRVLHRSESGFTVATALREDSGEELKVVGSFPPVPLGEPLEATGDWRNHPKWGPQFEADSILPVLPTSATGIERYLAAGHVKGIGPGLAKKLVESSGLKRRAQARQAAT